MFGQVRPAVKNLLTVANSWIADQTFKPQRTAASSSTIQTSPAIIQEGSAWNTGTSTAIPIAYKTFAQGVAGNPGYGRWKLQYSLNNSSYTDALTWDAKGTGSASKPLFTVAAYTTISTDNSSTIDTLQSLNVTSSGNQNHIVMSFGSTIRAGWSTDTNGNTSFKTAGGSPQHNFYVGSTITSQSQIMQIYSGGVYNLSANYTVGVVTAGQGDTSVQTTLSSYGSFALRGVLVNSSSYTLAQTETMVYCDPSNANFCTGTPAAACSSYSTETPCNAHSAVGCSWFAGSSCASFNGTDSVTCTTNSGCTWEETTCFGPSDQTACESQDDTYGGTCSWDTSTCPAQTDESSCSVITGCTWNFESCSALNPTDQTSCESNSGCGWFDDSGNCTTYGDQSTCEISSCYWDGSSCHGVCSGQYNTSCSGDFCTGTYATGTCSGTFGANCQGTAACANITSSSPCGSETGCTWTVGITVRLPTTANALRSTTGRIYSVVHVGSTGTCAIQGQSGENIFQYGTLTLFKKGDKVLLHNQIISYPCSQFLDSSSCGTQSGCTWLVVCSTLGDQSSCESAQCSWNGDTNVCEGRTTAVCSGTYSTSDRWFAHSLERGLNYVAKTATYTLTDIDDVVDCTSGTFTLNLPSAALNNGKTYYLKNTGAGTITVDPFSTQTIDGASTDTISAGSSMTIVSNNSNWIKV